MKPFIAASLFLALTGCGVIYNSPKVRDVAGDGTNVIVTPMTPQNVVIANASPYAPKALPAVFRQVAQSTTSPVIPPAPTPVLTERERPFELALRTPQPADPGPYRVGVGDVVLLATPQEGSTVEQLSGLLAASNARQGYTVQDDGAIAIPSVGRVEIAGMTLDEAEATLFQRLVENQLDPSFSLEVAEFNSKRVSVGGAVGNPTVVPVTLTPLYLDAALAQSGGITVSDAQQYASIRIYRDGTMYQIPLEDLYSDSGLRNIRLIDGDSIFVDTTYDLGLARAYFAEQIELAQFRQSARNAALSALNAEISLRRGQLSESRQLYEAQDQLGAIERDMVYMVGEMASQGSVALPYEQQATLADVLFGDAGGVPVRTGSYREIYVLRSQPDSSSITAWKLNGNNAVNLLLATRFEMRPNDIVFVPEQPVTRWNRTVSQIIPSLIFQTANALN